MKTKFLVTIDSDLTITPSNIRKALMDFDPSVKDASVEFQGTVYESVLRPRPLTFDDVRRMAERAGEAVVTDFLSKNKEPMYCGVAFLYTTKPKPRTRTNKVVEDVRICPTGFAANTQSLDLQKMWCKAAEAVFKEHGIAVGYKLWVD